MRAFLAMLACLGILLSGCTSGGGGEGGGDGPGQGSTGTASGTASPSASRSGSLTAAPSTSSTGTGSQGANRAPTGSVNAVVNGTVARLDLAGADPDGDALSWTLAFGDGNSSNGTTLPTQLNHTYAPGNHTVVYTVSDGRLQATYNATVAVAAASGPRQVVAGTWPVGAPGCAAEYPAFPVAAVASSGGGYFAFLVEAATVGRPYTMTMTWEATPAGLGGDIAFYDADGAYIEGNLIAGTSPLTFTGLVPAGASHAVTSVCDAPGAEIAYRAG